MKIRISKMPQDINTLELARIYESQGYYRNAHSIYQFLDDVKSSSEVKAGLKRCKKRIDNEDRVDRVDSDSLSHSRENISSLLEQWLMLMVLQRRLNGFKKIKSRLT
jgi:hypothetical protein